MRIIDIVSEDGRPLGKELLALCDELLDCPTTDEAASARVHAAIDQKLTDLRQALKVTPTPEPRT